MDIAGKVSFDKDVNLLWGAALVMGVESIEVLRYYRSFSLLLCLDVLIAQSMGIVAELLKLPFPSVLYLIWYPDSSDSASLLLSSLFKELLIFDLLLFLCEGSLEPTILLQWRSLTRSEFEVLLLLGLSCLSCLRVELLVTISLVVPPSFTAHCSLRVFHLSIMVKLGAGQFKLPFLISLLLHFQQIGRKEHFGNETLLLTLQLLVERSIIFV